MHQFFPGYSYLPTTVYILVYHRSMCQLPPVYAILRLFAEEQRMTMWPTDAVNDLFKSGSGQNMQVSKVLGLQCRMSSKKQLFWPPALHYINLIVGMNISSVWQGLGCYEFGQFIAIHIKGTLRSVWPHEICGHYIMWRSPIQRNPVALVLKQRQDRWYNNPVVTRIKVSNKSKVICLRHIRDKQRTPITG